MIIALSFGMIGCVKEPEMSVWKVEISSPDIITNASIKCAEYAYEPTSPLSTNYIMKEFTNPKIGGVGVKAWGDGVITIKMWKDGLLKEKSGVSGGSGLILNY